MAAEVDLKTIIEQNRDRVLELLDLGNTLVFEVKAEHRWTTHALETYSQLIRIMGNLTKLLETTEPDWGLGQKLFESDEGLKLWKTSIALWRAVPPIRAKYIEMLARRRRQRIMGTEIVEVEELDAEVIEQELETLNKYNDDLLEALKEVKAWAGKLPDGLAPKLEDLQEEQAKAKPSEEPADADEPEEAEAEAGKEPAPVEPKAQESGVVTDDEMSPV